MAAGDLYSELSGYLPGLSPLLTEKFIQRAWRQIRDTRVWSFLTVDDSVVCPAQIIAGTIAIHKFVNTVTADATASAAIAAVGLSVEVPFTYLSFRFGSGATSQIYNIVDVDQTDPTALIFTLDRVVVEPTDATSAYICYRPYVAGPVSDFLRWISVVDMNNGWALNLDYSSAAFDGVDPQRQAFGQAYNLGFYKPSTDTPSVPLYELWPGPTEGQNFYVRYRRIGTDFSSPTDVQPTLIPDQLIVQYALAYYAYPWARMNAGHFPALSKVNWSAAISDAMAMIHGHRGTSNVGLLQEAKRQDDNQSVSSVWNRGHHLRQGPKFPFPVDSNFIQSHLVSL